MNSRSVVARKTSVWLAFCFYIIIGFEFFYMISPFALYFYSVYQPGLEFMNENRAISWLGSTFLPHIVSETSSSLLNNLAVLGFLCTFGGAAVFVYGATLIYWSKLTKKSMVAHSIYTLARHPQYGALIICGFGMLLLWPRYIVLLSYVSMLFIYYYLARFEEKECLEKYGETYQFYQESTPMFFPLPIRVPEYARNVLSFFPQKGKKKIAVTIGLYVVVLFVSIFMANIVRSWVLDQLFARYDDNSTTISVTHLSEEKIEDIMTIVLGDDRVKERLTKQPAGMKNINYISPVEWSASEIPMHQIENFDHFGFQGDQNQTEHKVIMTYSVPDTSKNLTGKNIILHSKDRLPVLEVIVDSKTQHVVQISEPVGLDELENVPLPIF